MSTLRAASPEGELHEIQLEEVNRLADRLGGRVYLRGGQGYGQARAIWNGAEMITARGETIRAEAERNPDLLWALRGGGENLGVVTAFELRLHELGPEVEFLMPIYPAEMGGEALRLLQRFATQAPGGGATSGVFRSSSISSKNRRRS